MGSPISHLRVRVIDFCVTYRRMWFPAVAQTTSVRAILGSFIKDKKWKNEKKKGGLLVNVLAVGNTNNQHNQFVIFNVANHAVIPHPVTPQSRKVARQRLAKTAGIFIGGNALAEVVQNIDLGLTVEFAKLFSRCIVKLNCPGQGLVPSRPESSVYRGSQGD